MGSSSVSEWDSSATGELCRIDELGRSRLAPTPLEDDAAPLSAGKSFSLLVPGLHSRGVSGGEYVASIAGAGCFGWSRDSFRPKVSSDWIFPADPAQLDPPITTAADRLRHAVQAFGRTWAGVRVADDDALGFGGRALTAETAHECRTEEGWDCWDEEEDMEQDFSGAVVDTSAERDCSDEGEEGLTHAFCDSISVGAGS